MLPSPQNTGLSDRDGKRLVTPTEEQFLALNEAYRYFNRELFAGTLPGCILNFANKKNTHGYMAPQRWRRVEDTGNYSTHEISLTAMTLYREPVLVFSTLVHEQTHLWQWEFGKPSRSGYHNQEWADKMKEVGLMPSHTGKPGGKQTGQHMTHYILPGGKYELAFQAMPPEYALPFTCREADIRRYLLSGKKIPGSTAANGGNTVTTLSKVKYTCPGCKANVWGKPKLNLVCGDCGGNYSPAGV
jgi:predicted SprT family Zn-dependent metalloprotease